MENQFNLNEVETTLNGYNSLLKRISEISKLIKRETIDVEDISFVEIVHNVNKKNSF